MRHLLICDNTKPGNVADLCRSRGFGIEVQAFFHYHALANGELIEETVEQIDGLSPVAMHGPFGDLNPGSFDPLIREVSARRVQEGFDAAAGIGANHIVFHDGRVPKAGPIDPWIKRSATFWREFMANAPDNTHVYLENMLDGPEILKALIDAAECPNLHANLDIGHAHCNSDTPVIEWIALLGGRIGYVHLHDNNGASDDHLGLVRGTIPVREVLSELEEHSPNAFWALEAEGNGIEQSLAWLDEHALL